MIEHPLGKANGLRLIERMRARSAFCDLVIVALIRDGDAELKSAFVSGASDVVCCPYRATEIAVRIERSFTLRVQEKLLEERMEGLQDEMERDSP